MAESQSNENNTCVVCFKNVVYYSVGECDHPVCFECSTRMRVLCLQNECPICRKALEKVVFTETVKPYKELRTRVFKDHLFERQFKIQFCSEEIKKTYDCLLENRCKLCESQPAFRTFSMLNEHMRKVHERFFCDLCVKHLKIFTNERKCYTRQELAHHRRKGDLDDTSHRGHPLCEFCEQRFMDADELYRHLRKEHLYCHLCDADGRNLYYATHTALAQHFRTDHYLCEEGECANNHLTAVFRTEIDLKAHKATVHGRGLTRGAARQARTLELQFNIAPHPVLTARAPRDRDRQGSPVRSSSPGEGAGGVGGGGGVGGCSGSVHIDTGSDEQFPRLSAAPPAPQPLLAAGAGKHNRNYSQGSDRLARTDRNFPTLGGGSGGGGGGGGGATPSALSGAPASAVLRTSKPHVSIQLHSQPASASNFRLTQTSSHRPAPSTASSASTPRRPPPDDDFPSLGAPRDDHPALGAATLQPPKVTLINSQEMKAMKSNQSTSQPKRQPLNSDAFPALTSSAVPAAPPQWITVSKDKGKAKSARAEPAPKPRPTPPAFNPVADFPTLPANKAKPKKVSVPPVPSPAPAKPVPAPAKAIPAPSDTKTTKKERKKQNNNVKLLHQDSNSEPPTPTYLNGFTDKFTKRQLNEAYDAALGLNNNPTDTDRKIKTVGDNAPLERKKGGTGDFALASKDYPPLCKGAPLPEGLRPRTNGNVSAAGVLAAAAGGGNSGGGGRATCDGMTFTNSAGQEFSAVPHAYIPPPEFEKRNRQLARKLGGGGELAVASRAFRDGLISAEEFYAACEVALGPSLETLLPELVALLPDINRQQELARGRVLPDLTVCKACGQLLVKNDALAHDQVHWPPLAN